MEDLDLYGRRSLRGLGPQDFASSLLIADVRKSIIEITARPPKPKEARPVVLPSIVPPRPPRQSKRVVLGRKRKSRAPWDPLKGGGREKPLFGEREARNPEPPAPVLDGEARLLISQIAEQRAAEDREAAERAARLEATEKRRRAKLAGSDEPPDGENVAFWEVGERILADDADARVWEMVPALARRFAALDASDARVAEVCDHLHRAAGPRIRAAAAAYGDGSRRLNLGPGLRRAVEAAVRRALAGAFAELADDERVLRDHVTRLQKQLLRLGVKAADLAVVPHACYKYTTERGPQHGAPLPVQRAALRVQLDAVHQRDADRRAAGDFDRLPGLHRRIGGGGRKKIKSVRVALPSVPRRRADEPRVFADLDRHPYHEIWDHCGETRLVKPRGPQPEAPEAPPSRETSWNLLDEAQGLTLGADGNGGWGVCF